MNHIYRLIWNSDLLRWLVVPEIAKRHGKPSTAARSASHRGLGAFIDALRRPAGSEPPPWRWKSALCYLLALQQVMVPTIASAQTIVADGRTQTTVTTNGAVTNVTTGTVRGANAFNSFQTFGVGQGNTANLFLPNGTLNLINLVRDQRTTIDGILNAIKDGKIGGNVYFANPNGFLISASGIVNVGSLNLSTPTPAFIDNFFNSPGNPNDASVNSLLGGTAARNAGASIAILGQVNAIDGIALSAGAINVGGTLYSGARFIGSAPDFTDVVNANGLTAASNVVVREGRIEIVADQDVVVSGTIATPGGAGVRGGDVSIRAGGNAELQSGATIAARGNGENSAGGTVNIWADNNAVARSGALVDASAGSSGDGGAIEFSARNSIDLAGGEFRATSTTGQLGSVLIDPTNVTVSANFYSGGANHTIVADDNITVNSGVVVSTRNVTGGAGADQDAAASAGNSGNLTLQAGEIELQSGSKLLAHADNGYSAGDVTLTATRSWTGEAKVSVDGATIKGRNISLTAGTTYDDSVLTSWLPVSVPVAVSTVEVKSGTVAATGNLTLAATSLIDVSSTGLSPLGSIVAVSTASVDVSGASLLTASGDSKLNASSTVTAKATPGGPNPTTLPGDAGVAINVVVSTATSHVGGSSTVSSGGALEVAASNAVTATTKADASAGGAVAVGGTVALSEVTSITKASIDGTAQTQSASLKVAADSVNTVTTSAKAATKGAAKQSAAEKAAAPSKSEETLGKYKDQTTTADGSVEVAAAVAIANVNSVTQAYVESTGTQTSTGAASVTSKASSTSTVTADGSSAGGAVGVGAAVGVNIGVLVNQARIADNSSISSNGLTVGATMPTGGKNSFVTTATSGAGASNVGVAGALGVNVLVNTTTATLDGDTDSSGVGAAVNANGGDVVVEAANVSESKVTAGASVKPASATEPAAVGVGASVGMNVAVNTLLAEIENGARVSGANDLDLTAKADHTVANAVTGGAAGADIAVTPVAAITVAVNTTTARLGSGDQLDLLGAYASSAEQKSSTTSTATGQTVGNNVAVGASIALTSATDTVAAEIDRNIDAVGAVGVEAKSTARSSSTATASVAGGEKAKDDGTAPAPGGGAGSGQSVDEKVAGQGAAAKTTGKKTAASAPAATAPASAGTAGKLDATEEAPKTEDNSQGSGGVSVAAAVGVNIGVATTTAKVAKGRSISSSNGALKVSSVNETDASAKADGSQVDSGNTNVGVGAAVAINVGISTNTAVVSDNAAVNTKGLTVSAVNTTGEKSDYAAEATSGAGAGNVGIAGSLAANVVVNTTVAALEGDTDTNGTGASVNGGTGDILIEAGNATESTVKAGAKVTGTGGTAKVGVGASIGANIGVNTTVAEVADKAILSGGNNFGLNARGAHVLTTDVTGGASGAQVAVTPVAAVTVAVNTTTARLGESGTGIGISGAYSSTAEQSSSATTTATGQTQGDKVAVGASIGLTIATDTVTAEIERDVTATDGVEANARSTAKSSTTATASVAGGEKAKDDGTPPAPGGGAGSGQTVDEKVTAQGDAAKVSGKKTADKAPATTPAAGSSASTKLDSNPEPTPKAETSEGGVSVAAAVGVNVGVATTTAKVGKGRTLRSSGGALKVSTTNETDASAKADGSQVDGGNTKVGVGAAVALNVGVSTNVASIGDNSDIQAQGVTVSAVNATGEKSDYAADAKSGAGAGNVGVAGSLAANVVVNTTVAAIEGDKDSSGLGARVDADSGAVLIEAKQATTSTAKSGADVKMSGSDAKVGVGASIGVNVAVNTTVAEVEDKARLIHAAGMGLNAKADHAMSTTVDGGAAGAKVSITPVVAASIAVNTTKARLGDSATAVDLSGAYSSHAEQTSVVTTKATGQAQGDVAVGASLAASIAVDNVSATVERDTTASTGLDLSATSATSITTEAKAGAKGAKAAKKDSSGNETPEAGTTVDEQKKTQLDFAKGKNTKAAAVDTDTPEAKTPDTSSDTPGTGQPANPPAKSQQGKKVSVAAAIGASVAYNEAKAEIKAGKTVSAGTGKLGIHAGTDTNYKTLATGEAVSDDIGVAAAVALTATYNKTQARLGTGATVTQAGDVDISAVSTQNRGTDFQKSMSAEAVSGASGGEVAVAGSLAVVGNYNETEASVDEGATIGSSGAPVGDVTVKAEDTSKISAQARAGALSAGSSSKAGVGASFAVLLSYNKNTAAVGHDADKNSVFQPTNLYADSLTVTSTKNRVRMIAPTFSDAVDFVKTDAKNLDFDALDPSTYLGSNNYYTEAIAGAAAKGNAAVAGAFAINIYGNTTTSYLGNNVNVTTSGRQAAGDQFGVEVASRADTQTIAFSGAVAGAKKAGVGISNSDIVNLDETTASIGAGSTVLSSAADAGVKVSAESRQDIANVSVSAGAGTENTGVGGVLGVVVSLNKTEAQIGNGATVKSKGDLAVSATNDIATVMVSGGIGGGKEVGVGAAIAANIMANKTTAAIGSDAEVDAKKNLTVAADADESVVAVTVAGAGGGKVGVAGALSVNVIRSDTQASVGQGTQLNTDAAWAPITGASDQAVAITAHDDTVVVGVGGGVAGGGKVGVGAALDTTVLVKTVKAFIADDADGLNVATVNAAKSANVEATSTENIVSGTLGFGGGGSVGVGGAVGVIVAKNDVEARIGNYAKVDADGNVKVNAEDDITAVLVSGGGAGGGNTGVGGSIGVATLIGSTKATVGDNAQVNARGNRDAMTVYTGETVFSDTNAKPTTFLAKKTESAKGLSVAAYNRENLVTTVIGGAGGGTAGVAATVSAGVIATTTEASIGQGARINETNTTASAEQQVRVKAVDETLLIDAAGAGAGGGSAGVGAAANVGVIAKTTTAKIGKKAIVKATKAVELDAASSDVSVTATFGLAGGGSAGVGGSVAGVGIANTTQAYIEDATTTADAAKVSVSAGDLELKANEFSSSWLVTGAGAGGGAAGVGVSLAVGVNASTTRAKIGDYAETNASGTTTVHADSVENLNAVTVAGAGGGSAGVAGTIAASVVVSHTEAGIGKNARVNKDSSFANAAQSVDVKASDRVITVNTSGAGAGGGAAGVGATLNVTFAKNTTSAYIDNGAEVDAGKDVLVEASSEKYVNSAAIAGAGGGAAGVAGAVSVIAVGSLLDGEAKSGLQNGDAASYADGQTTKSAIGDQMGSSAQSNETRTVLDTNASKMAVGSHMADGTANIPLQNTQAFIGANAKVNAGEDVSVAASDKTVAVVAAGAGAGGGAAGVAGSFGVVLLHDSAEAFIADGAQVNARQNTDVKATTSENVFNVGITGSGAGAADVSASFVVNVVSSDTAAYIGDADINKDASYQTVNQSVGVIADSSSNLVTVAAQGGGAGAASVGGVFDTNVLTKRTKAYIGEGADVAARKNIEVAAASRENIVSGGISIRGAGAAAVSAVAAANVVANTTEAYIGAAEDDTNKVGATVDSNGNVRLSATDDTLIVAVSAVGNGAGAAGVGFNVGANVIANKTRAYVSDSSDVKARGNHASGVDVYNGTVGAATAMPGIAGGGSGAIDIDGDGTAEGSVNNGASFNVKGSGSGDPSSAADPTSNDVAGKTTPVPAEAAGGIGAKGFDSGVKGLSITAIGNEKVISAALGVAGAGAAAVTGAATANVLVSETSAYIGDSARINVGGVAGADQSVRVKAVDNTLVVQTVGTVAGAGAAAVSGAVNTVVVAKKTHAGIGDSEVNANNVEAKAASAEDIYAVGVNVSVAGAAGVGAATSVAVVSNETTASVDAGAKISATGGIAVKADQDTALNLFTISGAGGIVGVSGAFSVGVIDNTTRAYVEGATTVGQAATLDAGGTLEVAATSKEDILTATVSGAGGGVGVAGAVGVKVVKSTTEAFIGQNTQVNQTAHGAAQDVKVSATDSVKLHGGGGAAAVGGIAGVGATAEINIVRNTTTAYLGDSVKLSADRDVSISADSTKDVQAAALAASGGGSVGISGAVSLAIIGARLDSDSQDGIGNGGTASKADSTMKTDNVTGNMGDSQHLAATKTDIHSRTSALSVSGDLNETSTSSLDKTRAYVGSNAEIVAGGNVTVSAIDKTQVNLHAVGAAGGFVGIGGAVGVGITNSTTEAFIASSSSVDADGNVTVSADAGNVNGDGSKVLSAAGAGGVYGLSAAVAVLDDTSTTKAYLGNSVNIQDAATLTVSAAAQRKSSAESVGVSAGGIAIGASVARSTFTGAVASDFGTNVVVRADGVQLEAEDNSTAIAKATAGAAGIASGAGADAKASLSSTVGAKMATGADIVAQDDVNVVATGTASVDARAIGVSAGAAAVGVSISSATISSDVEASVGGSSQVTADNLRVTAQQALPVGGVSARADSLGAVGGLIGINGSIAEAKMLGTTNSSIGNNSAITGSVAVLASTDTRQVANASGLAVGILAAGANIADAESNTTTHATLGSNVNIAGSMTGGSVSIKALGTDTNLASATAGVGGIVAGSAASASTKETSDTLVEVGQSTCGVPSATCGIVAGSFEAVADHDSIYNAKVDSTTAAVAGASGSVNDHDVHSTVKTKIGDSVKVSANAVDIAAKNASHKYWWGQNNDSNSISVADNAPWNVNAGSGGLLSLPAARTNASIWHKTDVEIGQSTLFHVFLPTTGTGTFNVDALNTIVAYDKVKIDSGGAIALAESKSLIDVTKNDAKVSIGANSAIVSDSGDINIGSRASVKLDARAVANAYGAAGAPSGKAWINYTGNSTTEVLGGTLILAKDASHGAINIAAGDDSQQQASSIVANTAVNLWNKTAFPINSTPDARTNVSQNASLNVAATTNVLAAGDIGLAANRGAISVSAVGIGKDLYREAAAAIAGAIGIDASFDITGGSAPKPGGVAQVNVDGTVLSGLLRQSATQVDVEILSPAATPDDAPSWRLVYSTVDSRNNAGLAANPLDASAANPYITSVGSQVVEQDVAPDSLLKARITLLYSLKAEYASDPVAKAAYESEIKFLENKLGPQGVGQNSSTITPRASAAFTAADDLNLVLREKQSLITGNVEGATTAAQIGAVGSLINAYGSIDANNTVIDTNLTGMKNKNLTDATYVNLNTNRTTAATAYGDMRTKTAAIGNYAFVCDAGDAACTSRVSPLGAFSSTVENGARIVSGTGYLGAIQSSMSNISLLALNMTGASGTLVSNVSNLSTQMDNIKNANTGIISDASTLYSNLTTASTRQASLSTSWRDTASSDNVDTTRVSNVANRIALNTPLIAGFNDATGGTAANIIKNNAALVADAATDVAAAVGTVSAASNVSVPGSQKLITFPDISVKLGNVNIKGDILSGTGALKAPGDAKIWIINNAPASMNIGNLTVDSDGGNVRLNGFLVNNDNDVRRFNPSYSGSIPTIVSRENGAAGAPEIRIVSNYDPSEYSFAATDPARRIPAPAPDITLGYMVNAGDPEKKISNPNGSLFVTSEAGDIYVDGSITAGSISILARNGDFVQKYVNGFNTVAGDPNSNIQGGSGVLPPNTNAAPGAGIVANGSIFISARYLNINGLVQSGIVNYHLDIPSDAALRFVLPQNLWGGYKTLCGNVTCTLNLSGGRSVTYDANWIGLDGSVGRVVGNKAFIDQTVGQTVDVAVTENGTRDYAAIGASYDPAAQKIIMTSNVAVRGGNIQLFGQIINTASGSGSAGTGKLAVLDGFGQIAVNNQSSLAVELKSIDTGVDPDPANPGRGTVGKIEITDVQFVGPAGDQNLYAIHTAISRDQDAMTVNQTGWWNADGTFCPTCTTTSYGTDQNSLSRVSSTGPRIGAYNPQAGLRYVFTTGKKTSTEYEWRFSGASFFGTSTLSLPPDNVSKTLTSGPNVLENKNLADGTYLSYVAPSGTTAHQNNLSTDAAIVGNGHTSATPVSQKSNTYTTSDLYEKIDEWNTCNWWTLCIASRYTSIWKQTKGTSTITTNSVKADYPIQIEFMGANTAGLTVTSPLAAVSLGNERTLKNRYGDTSISATSFSAGTGSLIDTRNVSLTATNGSIGAVGAPVNLLLSGALTASATNGNVVANQIAGPLKVNTVSASGTPSSDPGLNQGLVVLTSQDDIYGDAGNLISGARIELSSATGTIGGIDGNAGAHLPLNVAPGYTADRSQQHLYGLKASAAGDIGIDVQASAGRNPDGNLLADTIVSAGGDVRLTAPGQILDNNPVQSIDKRVWGELINYWDKLGLVGGEAANTDKINQAIVTHENTRSQDYFQYWQIRNSQNAPTTYDAAWRYTASAAESSALLARGQDVATFEQNRTDRYWALNTTVGAFDAKVYARSTNAATVRQANPTWTQAQVDAQVLANEQGGLLPTVVVPTSYVSDFTYVASAEERKPYFDTGSWTTSQLALSLNPGLLKDVTDTNPVIKAPNVSGRTVTLVAGNSIGTTLPSTDPAAVFIPYDTDGNLSDAEKIALATAEYSDFKLDVTKGGKLGLQVEQRLPFNFNATTALNASVRQGGISTNGLTPHQFGTDLGNAYLASLGSGIIGNLSVDGELRFKVKGSISALNPTLVAINAGDVVLEAANASIGGDATATLPLRVNIRQDSGATADSYGSVSARSVGAVNIVDTDDVHVGGIFSRSSIKLASETGSILDAHANTGLDILGGTVELLTPQGSIGDIFGNLPISVGTLIGTTLSGLIEAAARDSVYLNGPAGGAVNSNFTIGPVVAGHNAITAGDSIRLTAAGDATINGDVVAVGPVEISVGKKLTISAGRDIEIDDSSSPTGKVTVATAPAAHIQVTGVGTLINADELVMEDGATLAADLGTIAITTRGDAIVTGISTGNGTDSAISITSTAGRILAGHTPGSGHMDIIADTPPAAKLTMSAALGIGAEPLNVRLLNLKATSGGVVDIAVQDSVIIDAIVAGDRILLTAGGSITGNSVTSTGTVSGSDPANPATGISLSSATGSVDLASVSGPRDVSITAPVSIEVDDLRVGDSLFLASNLITANVTGTGSGDHGGSVGGIGGVPASNVNLSLSSPDAFRFSSLSSMTGAIDVPQGDLWIDSMLVGSRMTVSNPQTNMLIDQTSRALQGFDVQLYTGGPAFSLGLVTNHVYTDALAIGRQPTHEVISSNGNNTSSLEQGNAVFNELRNDEDAALLARASVDGEIDEIEFEDPAVATEAADDETCPEGALDCEAK